MKTGLEATWQRQPLYLRLLAISVLGFILGGFIQGEMDSGSFPGLASAAAIAFGLFVAWLGWRDFAQSDQ